MDAQAADEAILVLAPMLLLLNQDPLVFRSLTERRRYAPLVLALTTCLVFSAVTGSSQKGSTGSAQSPFVMEQRQVSGVWLLTKNLALLALAVPIHIIFLRVWIKKPSDILPCPVRTTCDLLIYLPKSDASALSRWASTTSSRTTLPHATARSSFPLIEGHCMPRYSSACTFD